MPKRLLVSVFELTNTTRKEFFVWIEADGREAASPRPPHWGKADHIIRRMVESGLLKEIAVVFRDLYIKNLRQIPGWKHGVA